jgi:hypothetical protein
MRTHIAADRDAEGIARWRRERLVETGFPPPLAARLANDGRYDLHALIGLVESGCEPLLAVRILAPLEAETAA